MDSLRTLLAGIFDYAGLFPPAGLPLDVVVRSYTAYRRSPLAWMLGRLIVPVGQLEAVMGLARHADGWPVSVLVKDVASAADAATVLERAARAGRGHFRFESVEVPAATPYDVVIAAKALPSTLERYVEVPFEPDPAPLIDAVAIGGCHAKIRTGGVVASAFPSPAQVLRFMERCRAARISFKATAGLHHPLRASRALTYDADAPRTTMHGFVNLAMAATLRSAMRVDEAAALAVVEDSEPGSFRFGGRAAAWRREMVTSTEIAFARQTLLRAIGTCSVEEPAADLRALGWL